MSDTGPGTPSGRPLAVLVDDEVLFRLDVEFLLGEAGYEVAEASDAAEALPLIGNGRDVVLLVTDVRMPGEHDGLALAHMAAERDPSVAIVVVSAAVRPEPGDLPEGASFLEKPFTPSRLNAAVERARAAKRLA
ncbi:MAG: response regulator [Hyphomicrobiales bacterium]